MSIPIPTANKIIITKIEEPEKTAGGLYISGEVDHDKPATGYVEAVGKRTNSDGKELENDIKPGDFIVFPRYAGIEVTFDSKDYIILPVTDALAKLTQ